MIIFIKMIITVLIFTLIITIVTILLMDKLINIIIVLFFCNIINTCSSQVGWLASLLVSWLRSPRLLMQDRPIAIGEISAMISVVFFMIIIAIFIMVAANNSRRIIIMKFLCERRSESGRSAVKSESAFCLKSCLRRCAACPTTPFPAES